MPLKPLPLLERTGLRPLDFRRRRSNRRRSCRYTLAAYSAVMRPPFLGLDRKSRGIVNSLLR